MMRVVIAALSAWTLAVAAPALAQSVPPEAAFGAREGVASPSLSPDGSRMAFIAPTKGQGNALFTVAVDGSEKPRRAATASGDPEKLTNCGWVSNARLVCTIFALQRGADERTLATSRLIAVNIDGSDMKLVSRRDAANAVYFSGFGGDVVDWLPGQENVVLLGRTVVPEEKLGSLVRNNDEGYGVERVDTLNPLSVKKIVNPHPLAQEYISDGRGNVRMMGTVDARGDGYTNGQMKYFYRDAKGGSWQPFGTVDFGTREGFFPVAVDPEANVAYGFRKKGGRFALYTKALNGGLAEVLVRDHPQVDIDDVITIGRAHRIIGTSFATEYRTAEYFDPTYQKLGAALSKALPGKLSVNFYGASDDEQKLLLWAGSDVEPGQYYYFNRATNELRPLLLSRPELADYKLAVVKPVTYRAADGSAVPAYLTLPPGSNGKGLPAIVMPHGGPGSRDEWGFDWMAQYYAHKGYAVLQPNFRGSTGYGDAWYRENGFKSWELAIGDVVASGKWLVSEGIADPSKLAIVGWSYGGYAALQSGVVAPSLFKAIVAIAPVTDLMSLKNQYRDRSSQYEVADFIGSGPHIALGSPAQRAASIQAPVLLFHGEFDRNVWVEASKLMADKLRDAGKEYELVVYPKLDHGLRDSAVRTEMLGKSDAFLRKAMGM